MGKVAPGVRQFVFRAIIAFGIGFSAAAQTPADSLAAGATRWVAANAIPIEAVEAGHGFRDLQPFREVIGDARIVALAESTHGTREFFQLKHREELSFRLDADRHRRDFVIVGGSFGSRAVGAEAEIVLPNPAAVLVPPFRSCKPVASDGGTRCRVLLSAMHFRM